MIIGAVISIVFYFLYRRYYYNSNPYIKAHRSKWKNDRNYFAYLRWLSKKGGDIPIEQIKTKEEIELFREINK